MTDVEILTNINNKNDSKVVDAIYKLVLPNLKIYILSNGGTIEDACDILHDGILYFFNLVINKKFDSEKYSVNGFLYTLCKNRWINIVNKNKTHLKWQQSVYEEFDDTILDSIINEEKLSIFNKIFDELGNSCVEILKYFFQENKSFKDISELMNLPSENAARVKAHRCRKQLTDRINSNNHLRNQLLS